MEIANGYCNYLNAFKSLAIGQLSEFSKTIPKSEHDWNTDFYKKLAKQQARFLS